jgi:hypothetical protein
VLREREVPLVGLPTPTYGARHAPVIIIVVGVHAGLDIGVGPTKCKLLFQKRHIRRHYLFSTLSGEAHLLGRSYGGAVGLQAGVLVRLREHVLVSACEVLTMLVVVMKLRF